MALHIVFPNVTSVKASEFIEDHDRRYEEKYGEVGRRTVSDFDQKDQPDYPRGTKTCSVCKADSKREHPLDGRRYFCPEPACQKVRVRIAVAEKRAK